MKTFMRTAMILGAFGAAFVPAVSTFAGPKAKTCKKADKPAACPGGGAAKCEDGEWKCKELPTKKDCDDAKKPAACPGGGAAECKDGAWACKPLPKK